MPRKGARSWAFQLARSSLAGVLLERVLPRGLVLESLRDVVGDPKIVTAELVDRYYDMAVRAGNRRALVQRLEWAFVDRSEQIGRLRVPTLVLWGGRDRLIPVQFAQRFAHDIPGARLVVWPELGHLPQLEDPARTVAEVQRFLGIMPSR